MNAFALPLTVALALHVSRRAAREIERIAAWWSENRPAAPGAMVEDLRAALDLLLARPDIGGLVEQARQPGVRRVYLARMRDWLYNRVRVNRLEVLSVWHASRRARPSLR